MSASIGATPRRPAPAAMRRNVASLMVRRCAPQSRRGHLLLRVPEIPLKLGGVVGVHVGRWAWKTFFMPAAVVLAKRSFAAPRPLSWSAHRWPPAKGVGLPRSSCRPGPPAAGSWAPEAQSCCSLSAAGPGLPPSRNASPPLWRWGRLPASTLSSRAWKLLHTPQSTRVTISVPSLTRCPLGSCPCKVQGEAQPQVLVHVRALVLLGFHRVEELLELCHVSLGHLRLHPAVRQIFVLQTTLPVLPAIRRQPGFLWFVVRDSGVERLFVCTRASSLIMMSSHWCVPPSRSRKTLALCLPTAAALGRCRRPRCCWTQGSRKGGQWSNHFERAAGAYNARPHGTVHGAPEDVGHGVQATPTSSSTTRTSPTSA